MERKKPDDRSQMAVLTALATLAAFTVSSAPEGGLLLIIKQVTSITIKVESLSASGCP
jgi:hypothetical protein